MAEIKRELKIQILLFRYLAGCATLLFLFVFSPSLYAQTPPPSDTAGAEQRRFEEEQRRLTAERRLHQAARKPVVIEEEKVSDKPATTGPVFRLKKVDVVSDTPVPANEMETYTLGLLNRDVRLSDLQEVATNIKLYYRSQGYLAAYAYVPPQKIENGIATIVVVKGRLGQIDVQDNRWFSDRVIKRLLHLRSGEPIRYDKLRYGLMNLNKHRDIEAKAVLKPGVEPQTTDLELQVKDKFPFHLGGDVNNLGTENTGKTRWGITARHTNLLGQMDEATGRFQIGRRAWAVGSDYNIPVTPFDTRLGYSFSHTSLRVGGEFEALDIKGHATTHSLYALQPVVRHEAVEAGLQLGFDFKSVKNEILGEKSGEDELRILNTGLNLEFTDPWGKTFVPQSFHFGFSDFLGASDKVDRGATRPGTGGQFFIYRGSFIRYHRLPADMIFSLRGTTQLGPDALPPSEQLRLGGALSVRGYPEGEYLADYGAHINSELLIPTYFFPSEWKLPYSNQPLRKQIQGVAFFDFGGGGLRNPLPGEEKNKTFAGFGGGLRVHLFDKVFARFEWAVPTGSESATDGRDSIFYFGISAELF